MEARLTALLGACAIMRLSQSRRESLVTTLSVGTVAVMIAVATIASGAETDVPAWKKATPGTPAFLGDDGGGVNTVTVCDTADRFRDRLKLEHPPGCQTFQHDLLAIIEVVIFDPVEDSILDVSGKVGLPLVKVNIPSRNWIGYLRLLALHPLVPSGIVVHYKKIGNGTLKLFPTSKIGDNQESLDLGDQFSARVIKYDPSSDDEWDLNITILDGKYSGKSGWMLSMGADGDDGIPVDQFSKAVISKVP